MSDLETAPSSSEEDATWSRLSALVAKHCEPERPPLEIRPDAQLIAELGLSSIMAINLVLELEQTFDIVIQREDFGPIHKVSDLSALIAAKQAAARG